MKNRNAATYGFTLIEIMIVVAILGLLVVIALPSFIRMRLNANEDLIRTDLRAFSTGNESYRALQNPPVYAPDITTLQTLNYLDTTWTNPGNKHGHNFVYQVGPAAATYSIEATPLTLNVTGVNTYCVDQTGVIQFSNVSMGSGGGCTGGAPIAG